MSEEVKKYKIGDKVFVMAKNTLNRIEQIQSLIPLGIFSPDEGLSKKEDETKVALLLVKRFSKLMSEKATVIFSIILVDEKGEVFAPSFYGESLLSSDPVIQEVLGDFFILYDIISFYSQIVGALIKSFINSAKGTSGK